MYSNERKNGFSILDLLVKIIFAAIFIFILVWLFQKKIPNVNMTPFYSNVFRENIKYMQDAGEAYFTTDRLPVVEGESVKLTLEEMEGMNIVLPFVDKDGEACDKKESYVSVTKLENDLGYELKTNLVCGKESSFVTKTLGCHTYCPNNGVTCNCNCNGKEEKSCSYKQVTQYQFKKTVKGTNTKYSCDKGYTLKGKYCYKMVLKDTKSAVITKQREKTVTVDAELITEKAKLQQLKTVVTTKTDTQNATAVNTTDNKLATPVTTTDTKNATPVTTTDTKPATGVQQPYTCQKTRVEKQCTPKTENRPYSCNCKTTIINGKPTTTCNTCYEAVQVQSCKDVSVIYNDTCYKTVYNCNKYSGYTLSGQQCTKTTTSYNCNKYSGYTLSGTKCVKTTTTYNCNKYSGYTLSGIYCTKTTTSYNCNKYSGYTLSGTKCTKTTTTYSCPSGTDVKEGSGANLKCYKLIAGSAYYKCKDSSYKLSGSKCSKVVKETYTVKECPKNYTLEGNNCNLYDTTKVKAKSKTTTGTTTKYKWSTSKTLNGWKATGKTRTVKGEKVCK